jgi:tRNA(fMet)-specific endonuclease VapC
MDGIQGHSRHEEHEDVRDVRRDGQKGEDRSSTSFRQLPGTARAPEEEATFDRRRGEDRPSSSEAIPEEFQAKEIHYLLDSSVLIDVYRGRSSIFEALQRLGEERPATTVLNYTEVLADVFPLQAQSQVSEDIIRYCSILPITLASGKIFLHIKQILRSSGNLISDNDMLIASIAIENNLIVVTKDKHFLRVPGLNKIILK